MNNIMLWYFLGFIFGIGLGTALVGDAYNECSQNGGTFTYVSMDWSCHK